MYKIVIAESDEELAQWLERIILNTVSEAEVVANVKSGNDALLSVIDKEPDLLLISIQLSGLNGLETIQQIRRFNKKLRIIIITTLDYFEFVRTAMRLNVSDYVLKPLDQDEIITSIRKQVEDIGNEKKKDLVVKEEEKQIRKALRYMENNLIYSIMFMGNHLIEKEDYHKLLGIDNYGFIINIEIIPTHHYLLQEKNTSLTRLYPFIKDIVSKEFCCAVGPKVTNHIALYLSCDIATEPKEVHNASIRVSNQLIKACRDIFNLEICIGVGSVKPIERIHESHQEAIRCLHYKKEGSIIHIKEVRHRSLLGYDFMKITKELVEDMSYGGQEATLLLAKMLEQIRHLPNHERTCTLLEIFYILTYELKKEHALLSRYTEYYSDYHMLVDLGIDYQEAWAYRRLQTLIRSLRAVRTDRKGSIIGAAIEYIHRNYNQDISLNDVSTYVNLSPQHFSKIFKQATNENFVEWVADFRIMKSKEFMQQSDMTIKEICYLVGYQDPNYFSRIFKKHVGISPTEFVKRNR